MQFKTVLFLFRRDLRTEDNTALYEASKVAQKIIPLFIFDPRQIGTKNKYLSLRALKFMIESLHDLDKQLKIHKGFLQCAYGLPEEVLENIFSKSVIDAVFCNTDYTPFSQKRDTAIKHICTKNAIPFFSYDDALINPPNAVKSGNGTPYTIFTPFLKKAIKIPVNKPQKRYAISFFSLTLTNILSLPSLLQQIPLPSLPSGFPIVAGGSTSAKKIFKTLKKFQNYKNKRNFPEYPTTMLAAHLKFGTISIRATYHAIGTILGPHHELLKQLYWRDFFTYVAYHSPFVFGGPYKEEFASIPWDNNQKFFDAWCLGITGFPIIDAGMRQLNQTGFMHNRVRMIVGSFLVKNLLIDWRWGERYFAQHLIDYDPAVNNGNWQWVASTGCDAQPYFRIFNPWIQQKKFDPQCNYIHQWVPELRTLPPKIIHKWFTNKNEESIKYPPPIVDIAYTSLRAKELFRKAKKLL